MTLSLNTAIQSFHNTDRLMMMYHQTKFCCKGSALQQIYVRNCLTLIKPHCDLDLKDSKPIFPMMLWLMMMYHHATLDYKSSEVQKISG